VDEITVTPVQEQPTPESQPAKAAFVEDLTQSAKPVVEPELDDAAVRAAISRAEAEGKNPFELDMSALSAPAKTEVPEKFLKPDGEVDVEKLKNSARQLEEAVAAKEKALNDVAVAQSKTVEEILADYKEFQKKLSSTPNPEKVKNTLEVGRTLSDLNTPQTDPELEQMRLRILEDAKRDPFGTAVDLAVAKAKAEMHRDLAEKLKVLDKVEEAQRDERIRSNIAELAKNDPRVLRQDYYNAIKAKLEAEPELWQRKNPHRAAWLEIKDEMRLGEPTQAHAQPSKPPSPVLGGGTPPSAPSSLPASRQVPIDQLDPRDKRQEQMGDEFMRALLSSRK